MIEVTKLDGSRLFINEMNIQWIEQLPDTAITFLGGARVVVRDTPEDIVRRCNELVANANAVTTAHPTSLASVTHPSKT